MPQAPTGLTAVAGDGEITLSWDEPEYDGGSPVMHYVVEWETADGTYIEGAVVGEDGPSVTQDAPEMQTNDGAGSDQPAEVWWLSLNEIGTTGRSRTVGSLTNGTQYIFRVRAVNHNGRAEEFAAITATPQRP